VWELLLLTALLALSLNDGVFIGIGKRGPVYLPLDRHIIITGPTRSGKTRLAKRLIKRSGLPALILDWQGRPNRYEDVGVSVVLK
jgi:serine kinase of HPr protein (carbohydrate metabolism regulator)